MTGWSLASLLTAVLVLTVAVLYGARVGDAQSQSPSVSLAGIRDGQTLSGSLAVEAKVTGERIDRVEFAVDGRVVKLERRAPYCIASDGDRCLAWNSKSVKDGQHVVTATVYDRSGRKATATATITVKNAASEAPTRPAVPTAGDPPATGGAPVGGGVRLGVMSYNINWGAPSGTRLDAIAKVIASSGADVAGLQQVRRFAKNAKKGNFRCEDQPKKLEQALEKLTGREWYSTYAANTSFRQSNRHCKSVTSIPRQEGVLILSRYPIRSTATYKLPYERAVAKAVIAVPGGGDVSVFTVHLDSGSEAKRKPQAHMVADLVRKTGGTTFLTGDMNDQPEDAPIRTLREVVKDSWEAKGSGPGATRNSRIDYVFYKGQATPESVRVIQNWTSDHRPVVAAFSLG